MDQGRKRPCCKPNRWRSISLQVPVSQLEALDSTLHRIRTVLRFEPRSETAPPGPTAPRDRPLHLIYKAIVAARRLGSNLI